MRHWSKLLGDPYDISRSPSETIDHFSSPSKPRGDVRSTNKRMKLKQGKTSLYVICSKQSSNLTWAHCYLTGYWTLSISRNKLVFAQGWKSNGILLFGIRNCVFLAPFYYAFNLAEKHHKHVVFAVYFWPGFLYDLNDIMPPRGGCDIADNPATCHLVIVSVHPKNVNWSSNGYRLDRFFLLFFRSPKKYHPPAWYMDVDLLVFCS